MLPAGAATGAASPSAGSGAAAVAAATIKAVRSIREGGRVTLGAFLVARISESYIRVRALSSAAGRCEEEKRNGQAARAKDDGAACDLTSGRR